MGCFHSLPVVDSTNIIQDSAITTTTATATATPTTPTTTATVTTTHTPTVKTVEATTTTTNKTTDMNPPSNTTTTTTSVPPTTTSQSPQPQQSSSSPPQSQPPPPPQQSQPPQSQQRQITRNIFAKPLLIQNVVTAATNTVTNTVQNTQQQIQNTITSVMSNKNMTTTTKSSSVSLPYYEKSTDILDFLMDTLSKHFVFESCTKPELQQLCYSMEPYSVPIGTKIIEQGNLIGDYCYIIMKGCVTFIINQNIVGTASQRGTVFGELSLLYSAPRAATVMATKSTTTTTTTTEDGTTTTNDEQNENDDDDTTILLYRLDQITFRTILQQQALNVSDTYITLLRKVSFLKDLDDYNLYKLSSVLQVHTYEKDTIIVQKGDVINANVCYILVDGIVTCSDITISETCSYSNIILSNQGDYFGERAIMTGEPRAATVTATSNTVTCYTIDKITFDTVLGNYSNLIVHANKERVLSSIPLISNTKLSNPILKSITQLVKEVTYTVGTKICEKDVICEPTLYMIRTGQVTVHKSNATTTIIGPGGYFGDDQLLFDKMKKEQTLSDNDTLYRSTYTVVAGGGNSNSNNNNINNSTSNTNDENKDVVTVGILTLSALRTIIDTQYLGQPMPVSIHKDSLLFDRNIVLSKLQRHTILGAGTFGMVYLVSRTNAIGERVAYALKVQSKYELIQEGQALAVICEKNIMAKLQHPFLIGLINTYHDDTFVYILLQLIQGGELYSYIHTKTHDYLSEDSSRFYAACIGEGLGYMHKQGYVYRDLKPENVLVDHTGYCVIIDFGFAKYVPIPTKTFTLCGTPLYIAPEVILNRGHNHGADHWSYGILIFEMLYGSNPFYQHGMDQMDLFRSIVKARFGTPATPHISDEGRTILKELLSRDPNQRLGNLAAGEDGILYHPWFSSYNMDMDELRAKKYKAPVIPNIKDPLDSSNFENWDHLDDKTKKKFPTVSAEDQLMFQNF